MHKNEDFGSIFMFMNKRCPFTVRVKSRKAEMFILKKNDVLQLAEEYQNIWRRLNKKALKNMKGIKNMVTKAVNKYCELKGVLIKNSTTNLKAKKHHFGSMIDTNNFNQSDLVDENIRKTIRNNSGKFHTVVTIGNVKTIKLETTNILDKNYNLSSDKIQKKRQSINKKLKTNIYSDLQNLTNSIEDKNTYNYSDSSETKKIMINF